MVLATPNFLTTRDQWVYFRSPFGHLPAQVLLKLLLQRSPPRLLIAAAWSGLRSAPEHRSRGAHPHHSRSFTTVSHHLLSFLSLQHTASRPPELHRQPLSGRVEAWRAGLGRSLFSPFLALSFASVTLSRPCHVSSPRHVERSVRISRTALSCLLHLKGYGTYRAGATFGVSHRTL